MTSTKTYGIRHEDFDKLIEKLNEFAEKNNIIATQTHQHITGEWFAIVYYDNNRQGQNYSAPTNKPFSVPAKQTPKESLEPKEDNTPATPSQISFLKKNAYLGNTSNLTKYEAWSLINGFKKGD